MTQAVYLKKGTTSIYIESASVEEIIMNKMIKVPMVVIAGSQDPAKANYKPPGTLVYDLKRFEHVFNITGFLSNAVGSGNEGYASTKLVKCGLIKDILFSNGDIELHYRDLTDRDYSLKYNDGSDTSTDHVKTNLDKVSIGDASTIADSSDSSGINRYKIQINLTRGKIR